MPIERLQSAGPWESAYGYARVVRAGPLIFVAGTTAVGEDGIVLAPGDPYSQAHHALDAIEAALARAGAGLADVVRTHISVVDIARADDVGRAHGERFGAHPPVATMVQVAALIDPRMLVEIEATAYVGA